MSERSSLLSLFPQRPKVPLHFPVSSALRKVLSQGYKLADFRADALALSIAHMAETYLEKVRAMWTARASASLADFAVAAAMLGLLLALPRLFPAFVRRVPAPLIGLVVTSLVVVVVRHFLPSFAPA